MNFIKIFKRYPKIIGVILSLYSLFTFSCKNQNNGNFIEKDKLDSFVKDIPKNKSGQFPLYYRNKPNVEKKLKITTLENGFDSIQIRIWYGYAFKDSSQLVILTKSKGKWNALLYNFIYIFDEKSDSVLSIKREIVQKDPISGWGSFSNLLFELGVMTLPDDSKISGYPQAMDGDAIIIEVATRNLYRIYSYQEPRMNQYKSIEAKKMERMLELIEQDFTFERLRKL